MNSKHIGFAVNDIVSLEGTNYIATASRDKSIRIWQKQSMDLVKKFHDLNLPPIPQRKQFVLD